MSTSTVWCSRENCQRRLLSRPKVRQSLQRHGFLDIHKIWYGGNTIQGDLDAIYFNPISSAILKW
jgi:hypothetical protein